MIKGVNRNVIVVKGDKDSRFETVYMIMKKGALSGGDDILKEADHIVSAGGMGGKKKARMPSWLIFLLGVLGGGGIAGVAILVVLRLTSFC